MKKIKNFSANGKIMLAGEYLVLEGATSLAVPSKLKQYMIVEEDESKEYELKWKVSDTQGLWFEGVFNFQEDISIVYASDRQFAERLVIYLKASQHLNTDFLSEAISYNVESDIEFHRSWGLGTSSSFIYNLAKWAMIDPFDLHRMVSDGSGYDIACAGTNKPILYKILEGFPIIEEIEFDPEFHENLVFVHLNSKQDSAEQVEYYKSKCASGAPKVKAISEICKEVYKTQNLSYFIQRMDEHEHIIAGILKQPRIKDVYFPDFRGTVKSLGAWGGDFVLAISDWDNKKIHSYFRDKGYKLTMDWKELV